MFLKLGKVQIGVRKVWWHRPLFGYSSDTYGGVFKNVCLGRFVFWYWRAK